MKFNIYIFFYCYIINTHKKIYSKIKYSTKNNLETSTNSKRNLKKNISNKRKTEKAKAINNKQRKIKKNNMIFKKEKLYEQTRFTCAENSDGRVEPASKFHELEKAKKWAGLKGGGVSPPFGGFATGGRVAIYHPFCLFLMASGAFIFACLGDQWPPN